jgi:hypothetical protein
MAKSLWMMSAAILAATTACGGKAKGPATGTMNSGPTTTPVPAPHYAALFKEGSTWAYDLKATATGGEGPDDKTETTGASTCKVAKVGTVPGGVTSTITCDQPMTDSGAAPVDGTWVANATGLYKFDHLDEGAALDLSKARLVIAAAPEAGTKNKETGQDPVESESWTITRDGDAWCANYSYAAGDESFEMLCFSATGIVHGSAGWAGGSVHETTFTLKK